MILPRFLYRGDRDSKNIRHLKTTFKSSVLLTNLCNGGVGKEIFIYPIGQLINKHIGVGWDRTHFLSFSSDKSRAFYYACNNSSYDEVYDYDNEQWDFAVMTLDTNNLIQDSIIEIEHGIYQAEFIPISREFLPKFKILLINAFEYLTRMKTQNDLDLTLAITNAKLDNEWLVLPANPFNDKGEFTAKLDINCLSEKKAYRYED